MKHGRHLEVNLVGGPLTIFLKEVWNSSIEEAFMCFTKEENSHDRKAVISMSDDISKRNIASEPLSGANTIVKHCSKGVYSH